MEKKVIRRFLNQKMVSNILKYGLLKTKHIVIGKPKFKQELLFRLALKEKGFNLRKLKISCNHILGKNYVNGVEFGIKYPDSFFHSAIELIPESKEYEFYFNGNMSESGERSKMLRPFMGRPHSVIIASDEGRIQNKKDKFNLSYFSEFAKSRFGLCPHQADWTGDKDAMWTYRFIESCFVEAIPVIFKEAPLGEKFTSGFHSLWDTEVNDDIVYDAWKAVENKCLAKERFLLSDRDCSQIRDTL